MKAERNLALAIAFALVAVFTAYEQWNTACIICVILSLLTIIVGLFNAE